MNVIIDAGNTKVKLAVFDGKDIIIKKEADTLSLISEEISVIQKMGVESCIFSSVRKDVPGFISHLESLFKSVLVFSQHTATPLEICYKTPLTLGLDRIASAVGAKDLFPEQSVFVVDAGTAITLDFVSDDNKFMGGNISPGLQTRFRALHNFTGKLPLHSPDPDQPFLGTDTKEAIVAGVQNGAVFEIEAYISRILEQAPSAQIVLTGGDAEFFEKQIKSSIFVDSNLVLKGLNKILRFNL